MSDVNHNDIDCPVIGCGTCAIRKMNSNWVHGSCVKCGQERLFWKDATGKRCNECEKEGSYPTVFAYEQACKALEKERLKTAKLREALEQTKCAIVYAYDYSMDQYYMNVHEDIVKALAETEDKT